MAREIQVFPDIPAHIQTVELAGRELRIRLRWRERMERWYIGFFETDGTAIRTGKKITPGYSPSLDALEPEQFGILYVDGPLDDYERYDLGSRLKLYHFPPEDLPEDLDP